MKHEQKAAVAYIKNLKILIFLLDQKLLIELLDEVNLLVPM